MARKRQARKPASTPINPMSAVPRFRPKNQEQAVAKRLCDTETITVLSGPAGTAKTYCAIASAVDAMIAGRVKSILLTRPAIEACGERMGYLPGAADEKLGVYISPLTDAIGKYCRGTPWESQVMQMTTIVPRAYMRGRTLDNTVCIMDEAQNATAEQIKMFLTRIGEGSSMILAGDTEQSDISATPLKDIARKISQVDGVEWLDFSEAAIVRHPIISEVLKWL